MHETAVKNARIGSQKCARRAKGDQSLRTISMNTALNTFFRDIKISHTVFALPFALMATLLAAESGWPSPTRIALIILCMFGARTWAMSVNRLADAQIDRANPRTQNRALPSGQLKFGQMLFFATAGAAIFVAAAALISTTALVLSFPVLAILASYSFAKRITWLCHFWLGLCLGLAPLGAWVAMRGELNPDIAVLGAGIMFWVGGFDIIYALQDEEFDRTAGLKSIPATFGSQRSMQIARFSHALAGGLFIFAGHQLGLGLPYFAGVAGAAALLVWQHRALAKGGAKAIPFAFFNLNAWVAVLLFFATFINLFLNKGFLP